jgi:hypothetical protein
MKSQTAAPIRKSKKGLKMTDYQVNFVYPFSCVSVSVKALDEDQAAELAEKMISHELGLIIPKNVSVEISEIN